MPRTEFATENKLKTADQYPKLTLKKDEVARVWICEKDPFTEFTHSLRAPAIDPSTGKPATKLVKRNNEMVPEQVFDFVGRHICFGSYDIVSKKGVDVDGCPTCKKSKETSAIASPQRRFAMHIIRYRLTPGTAVAQEPFSVELLGWAFGEKVFTTITDQAVMWASAGGLVEHDLFVKCTNEAFQNLDIQIAPDAEYAKSDARKQLVKETYVNGKCPDLTPLIGRKISKELALEDIERVMTKHREVFGGPSEPDQQAQTASIDTQVDISEFLGTAPPTSSAAPGEGQDLFGPTDAKPSPAANGETMTFDSIENFLDGV